MRLTVHELLAIPNRGLRNGDLLRGKVITGVATDSRTVRRGDLFVALRGERTDGHHFVNDAATAGAVAAVVEVGSPVEPASRLPLLAVDDSIHALGELARLYRRTFDIPVLAVAGSNGKTTTKEMIVHVLRSTYHVLGTEGNLNNQIGVPQTLFRLRKRHEVAVVEIGTNHPGEIDYLCRVLEPTHGLITNIGNEHLEFFGSLSGVAKEEGALFASVRAGRGFAFVNADDVRVVVQARGIGRKVRFGFAAQAVNVRGRNLTVDNAGRVRFEFKSGRLKRGVPVALPVPGRHQAPNALAAISVGLTFRVPVARIRRAVETFAPASKRMEVIDCGGVTVYNDTYNANPDSMLAALRTLASVKVPGKKIAVLADMRELGDRSAKEHTRVGRRVAALGIEYVLTYGDMARHIHEASGRRFAVHYDQKNMLAEYLAELVSPGDAVLVKGSRGMKMEDVVHFLQERRQRH